MCDAAEQAIAFAKGRSRSDLGSDRMLAFALVKALEIVGEAANQVAKETRDRYPKIPWLEIVGMRHRLIHAYFDIDLDILWQTVQGDLPSLVPEIRNALGE